MNVLIACEFSGRVREAFKAKGHDAISCDLLDTEIESENHYKGDVRDILNVKWDMLIGFPPCTYLTKAGSRYWAKNRDKQEEALEFFRMLLSLDIPHIALENPIGIISTRIRKPNQIINPYQFGHPEKKMTCLWLKNLPLLKPTKLIPKDERIDFISSDNPDANRWKHRSRTFTGIAEAMADQWDSSKIQKLQNLQDKSS